MSFKPSNLNTPSSQVSESEGATFVNPADQDIDEEAERKAFQDAVMEWRNIGKTVAKESSGLWSNPIGDGEAEEERGFNPRAAVSSGTEVIGGSLADGELDEEKERAVSGTTRTNRATISSHFFNF